MISCKRKRSTIDDSQESDPKRSRISSGTVYDIKAIVDETKYHYLIDWADDSVTGRTFTPDWQPKANVSTTAVEVWKSKQAPRNRSASSGRQTFATDNSSTAASYSAPRTRITRQHRPPTSNRTESSEKPSKISSDSRQHRSSSGALEALSLSDLIVRVSQHSSLDRDLYTAYESSLSTQASATASNQLLPTQSQLPSSNVASQVPATNRGIVPDSQALPQSSNREVPASTPAQFSAGRATRYKSRRSISAPPSTIPDSAQTLSLSRTPPSLPRTFSDTGRVNRVLSNSQESIRLEVPDSTERKASASSTSLVQIVKQVSSPSATQYIAESPLGLRHCSGLRKAAECPSPPNLQQTIKSTEEKISQATTTDDSSGLLSCCDIRPLSEVLQSAIQRLANKSSLESQKSPPPPKPQDFSSLDDTTSLYSPPLVMESPILDDNNGQQNSSNRSAWEATRRNSEIMENRLAQLRAEHSRASTGSQNSNSSSRSPTQHTAGLRSPHRLDTPSNANRDAQRRPRPASLPTTPQIRSPTNLASAKQMAPSPGPSSPLARHPPAMSTVSSAFNSSRAVKSPSIIPDRLPYQATEEPSRLLAKPLELDTAPVPLNRAIQSQSVPHTPITPSKLSLHKEVSISPEESILRLCNISDREHVIPLPMQARIQQQYCTTIRYYARTMKKFFEEKPCKRDTVESINRLLEEVSKVSTHIDLQGSGPASQEDLDPQGEAEYAESCSAKFAFLGQLLKRTGNLTLDLYIVAKPGPLMSIIEIFLNAKQVKWYRVGEDLKARAPNIETGLTVFLARSDENAKCDPLRLPEPHLIVGFDETFEKEAFVATHWNASRIPVLRPLVYASLEHIDLCVPRTLNPIERLQKLVYLLLQTQKRVGLVVPPDLTPNVAAERIAPYASELIRDRSADTWPLPPLQPIDDIAHMESDSSLSDARSDISDEYKPKLRYWPSKAAPKIRSAKMGKRPFDLEWSDSVAVQSKKQKIGQQYAAISDEFDVSLDRFVRGLWLIKAQPSELVRQAKEREPSEVERDLEKKTHMVKDLQEWAEIRQHDFEKLRRKHGDLEISHEGDRIALEKFAHKFEKLQTDYRTLIEDRIALRKEIADQQAHLNNHSNSEIAAAARNVTHQREIEAEVARLNKLITNHESEVGFVRQQYQAASSAAADLSNELEPLKTEVGELRKKQESNIVENRRLRDEDVTKSLRKEVQRLKQTVKQRDSFVEKLEREMVEIKRGRAGVQTRGSSVQPKSPRGPGSRGVSPAPGLLGQGGHAMARAGSGLGARFRD
ncbi:uncharacterized protein KY384_005253 [Bacidia gigantensis]|uniref:uncharacterized protein n=1 Tax=Bacidia gigantensis TaxID=2732470 RepID=UPI001D037DB1|nr:uncharacterized protein KY384_005253 [Bacidia gigantensis]KAG8529772.1 hypothetical protein KY384_005253 [Bacidia gigantensis]